MKYNQVDLKGKKTNKRVGRGISAGGGKTAGRGTKGQRSRSGWSLNPGFEGGQNPLLQRLPKFPSFKSHKSRRWEYLAISTSELNKFKEGAVVDNVVLHKAGIINKPTNNVKVVFKQTVTVNKLDVRLQGASKSSIESIQSAGGSFTKTPVRYAKKDKSVEKD
jgi:large subunit ribosomal protein L15